MPANAGSHRRRLSGGGDAPVCSSAADNAEEYGYADDGHRRLADTDHADDDHADDDRANANLPECADHSQEIKLTWECLFVLMIVLSAIFELLKDTLLKKASSELHSAIHHMFAELTALGFVSLCLFMFATASWIHTVSIDVFGEENEYEVQHLFELVHMGLFVVVIAFLLFICYTMVFLHRLRETNFFGELLTSDAHKIFANFAHAKAKAKAKADPANVMATHAAFIGRARKFVEYLTLRQRFLTESGMPAFFDFAHYLQLGVAEFVDALVEIDPKTWGLVWVAHLPMWIVWYVTAPLLLLLPPRRRSRATGRRPGLATTNTNTTTTTTTTHYLTPPLSGTASTPPTGLSWASPSSPPSRSWSSWKSSPCRSTGPSFATPLRRSRATGRRPRLATRKTTSRRGSRRSPRATATI